MNRNTKVRRLRAVGSFHAEALLNVIRRTERLQLPLLRAIDFRMVRGAPFVFRHRGWRWEL
jgi:hypothetical protein